LVVFNDPDSAFIGDRIPSPDTISVFDIANYVANSDDVYGCLAKGHLTAGEPPSYIRPEHIRAHLSAPATKKLFRGIWVRRNTTGSAFDVHPQILIYPALLVQRTDEEFVTIVDNGLGHDSMPKESDSIRPHIDAVRLRSERLLAMVQALLPGLPAPSALAEFPGFVRSPSRGKAAKVFKPDDADRDFLRAYPQSSGQYVLATGEHAHFIMENPRVAACLGHSWAECKRLNEHVGDTPVVARSVEPMSFFISDEPHHCAQRVIHARRVERCKVRAFETFLCCQACTYQPICWKGVGDLPCGIGTMRVQATPPGVPGLVSVP
jgi:hypothetical protein